VVALAGHLARHWALTIAYDGTAYAGWQRQPGLPTLQGRLEAALSELDGEPVTVRGAGRTDAGVHAVGQVADCWLRAGIPAPRLPMAANRHLPPDIRVVRADEVPADFHARFSALGKRYRYLVWTDRVASPFLARYTWHRPGLWPTLPSVHALVGRQDFRSFAGAGRPVSDAVRTITSCRIWRQGPLAGLEVEADGFLYKMVRAIVGTLAAGMDAEAVLAARDRRRAGPTAPAAGLSLIRVRYPEPLALNGPVLDTFGRVYLE
jgi:tRNA pseudouridine38-40 synthase